MTRMMPPNPPTESGLKGRAALTRLHEQVGHHHQDPMVDTQDDPLDTEDLSIIKPGQLIWTQVRVTNQFLTGATDKFLTNIFLYACMTRAEDDEDDATVSTEPIRPD